MSAHTALNIDFTQLDCPLCDCIAKSNSGLRVHIYAMHPSEWEEYKIRHYASNLSPQWDEDTYRAIASMEKPLLKERSSEAEQNLHTWLSQLFAISCNDVGEDKASPSFPFSFLVCIYVSL
ncbi:REST [Lepeophtheirus salmonis]|uniref:REST n=1 Tax=Lepeophtheirus salmonis TaxID=72036 RepID=A0A7R8D818_LEPSM|nr:REST [Lepeophtheirus salmonis]CAF3031606.1 REST [Lepeophtheirus salmonis]